MTDPKEIGAFVDGELDASAEAAFRARLATDEALAREVARHEALRARLRDAYGPVAEEPVPQRFVDMILDAPQAQAPARGGPWRPMHLLAVAASLVVGVFAGRSVLETGPLQAGADGRLVARGALAQALDRQLASQQQAARVQVGMSFKVADGGYCRTFQSGADHLAGIACRDGGRWVARLTTAYAPAAATDYRTAGVDIPSPVLAGVDAIIVGDPLDRAGEQAARDAGWRSAH